MRVQPWDLVFLAGFIVYVGVRGAFERRTSGIEKTVTRTDALERVLLLFVGVASLLLPMLYLFTPWLNLADYRLSNLTRWCGTAVMGLALWLFWRSHADLGQNWSRTLELRRGHQLVQHGVYRFVRHPMYASIFLWDLAQGLLLQNWLAGWSALVTFAVLYSVRTPREEQMMSEFFGQEYRDYMRHTGRLVPRPR
jgi:protein-S-isoprenylcysteine O-methyltransferase Ste14